MGRVGDGVKVREIFLYAAHADAVAAALDPDTQVRIRVARDGGQDVIELSLSGPEIPEDRVRDVFRRITRLRADTVRRVDDLAQTKPLEDARDF